MDDYATLVLEKHWPNVKRYRDVREVGAHNLEPVDLICGGFPCQDVSVAGKQAGIDGKKTGLWKEMCRIIGELRPRYVLAENVPGLISTGGLNRVLADLAEIWYDAEWQNIPATSVGAPHNRERIFLIAYPRGNECRPLFNPQHEIQNNIQWDTAKNIRTANGWKRWLVSLSKAMDGKTGDPWFCGMDDGLPGWMDRHKCLGNAVVPQVAQVIGEMIIGFESSPCVSCHE